MKRITVRGGGVGKRLDMYLVSKLKSFSRSEVKSFIDSGRVKVNGKRVVIAKWKMLEGDEVEVRTEGGRPQPIQGEGNQRARSKGKREIDW